MKEDQQLTIREFSSAHVWDYENGFYWFSHPVRLQKMLAHYELFKTITNLPGDVFELGVYKGASLIRLGTFRNLMENDFSRKIIGFDAYGKFPTENLRMKSDMDFIHTFEEAGGLGLDDHELKSICSRKGFDNIELVKGNIFSTLPEYLARNPATRIAFLHLDMDVREPTEFALSFLYDRVVPNGLIVFDDYGTVAGETEAVDQFVQQHNLTLEKMNYYKIPAFIRKPAISPT